MPDSRETPPQGRRPGKRAKVILPLVVLLAGIIGAAAMIAARPQVETRPAARPAPFVRVVVAEARPVRLSVTTYVIQ